MVYFSTIYKQALVTLQSQTFAELTDSDLKDLLDTLLMRSIADFRFPRVSLTYDDAPLAGATEDNLGYYFTADVTQNEFNVLLALMKRLWLQQQLDNEDLFEQKYMDASIRTHSSANMLSKLKERYEIAIEECNQAQYDYSRVGSGASRVTVIYKGLDSEQ
jgi:hypothetical protein